MQLLCNSQNGSDNVASDTELKRDNTNLIPFPCLLFFMVGSAPLTTPELTHKMRGTKDLECADPRQGRTLTTSTMFRSKTSTQQMDEPVIKVQNKNSSYFVEGIPNNAKPMVMLKRINNEFIVIFRRETSLHWYTKEGMNEIKLIEDESFSAYVRKPTEPARGPSYKGILNILRMLFDTYKTCTPFLLLLYDVLTVLLVGSIEEAKGRDGQLWCNRSKQLLVGTLAEGQETRELNSSQCLLNSSRLGWSASKEVPMKAHELSNTSGLELSSIQVPLMF